MLFLSRLQRMCVSIFIHSTMLLLRFFLVFFLFFLCFFFFFFSLVDFSRENMSCLLLTLSVFPSLSLCLDIHREQEKRQRTQGYNIWMQMNAHCLRFSPSIAVRNRTSKNSSKTLSKGAVVHHHHYHHHEISSR